MILQHFYDGKSFDSYEYFGAHEDEVGFTFRTYAPKAQRVTLIGEFNDWEEEIMEQELLSGVFSISGVSAEYGMMYKYCIYSEDGIREEHCDPYGFSMELRPGYNSIITDLKSYHFNDKTWMDNRSDNYDRPLNIYELHMGSWKRKAPEDENEWYSYSEIADPLIDYVKENGYTHIEIMPLSEHPCDESWGYQNTGFFAPTSRYGTPEQLKKMIDKLHQAGIGVILDFVPVHFAVDAYALQKYDGTCLYEYPYEDVARSEWGSNNFMYARCEVRSFMQSSANYWLKEFHFDGLRMDAVSRLIYWQGDESRGVNEKSIEFLKTMNEGLKQIHPTAMLIAEDSSNYRGVTEPVTANGLGFDYKWDLGWMHDTLEYFQTAPEYRPRDYHKLTFSMQYFYNERYLLAFSHDEVVHGKATILQKMYGLYGGKFQQGRAMYMYMMVHPGKKLNFMANEIGQFREWDEKREQDWDILKYPIHDSFHKYMMALNQIYKDYDALHDDYNRDNFRWADCHQDDKCIYAISRYGTKKTLLAVFNFSDKDYEKYSVPLQEGQEARLILHSDWQTYDGTIPEGKEIFEIDEDQDGQLQLSMELSRYSGILFEITESDENNPEIMKNKWIAVIGSPRKGHNTDILVNHIIEGLKEKNIKVRKFYLDSSDISTCTGCEYCISTGTCCINDRVTRLINRMKSAGGYIFASPSYNYNMTAQMKALLDRTFCLNDYSDGCKSRLAPGKKVIIAGVCAGKAKKYMGYTVKGMDKVLSELGIKIIDEIEYYNTNGVPVADNDTIRKEIIERIINNADL